MRGMHRSSYASGTRATTWLEVSSKGSAERSRLYLSHDQERVRPYGGATQARESPLRPAIAGNRASRIAKEPGPSPSPSAEPRPRTQLQAPSLRRPRLQEHQSKVPHATPLPAPRGQSLAATGIQVPAR